MTLTSNEDGFAALASSSLPTIGADPLQPSWSRSLPELMAANHALIGDKPQKPTAAAKFLLGDKTDFGALASSLEKPKPRKTETFVGVVEGCRKHRDGIIERILQKEREQTQLFLEKNAERQREEDWAREREWWMEEIVGTRNFVDPSNKLVLRQPQQNLQALPGPSHRLLPDSRFDGSHRLDTRLVQAHLELVKSLAKASASDLEKIVSDFHRLASPVSNGYATAWQLIGSVVPRMSSPINGALGSLIHFCRQYQTIIKDKVNSASLAGQNLSTAQNYGNSVAGRIAAYVKLEFGSSATIWHILYFCLRCGDFASAKKVLDASSSSHASFPEQPLISRLIGQLSHRQGNALCIWETGVPTTSANELLTISDLHEKAQNLEPENKYKIGVLALLSGRLLASFDTVEDYLFARLWCALHQQDPMHAIQTIGESIKKYGPNHFGADESDGWGYALPLLAAQQFKTALVFLADAGGPLGLLQAVHLGLILSFGGVDVRDFGRDNSSAGVVTALLVNYASALEGDPSIGAVGGLEYLLRIPDQSRIRQEIASLIGRVPQLVEELSGGLSDDGTRREGVLDRYLATEEVNRILADSAEIFRRQSHDRQKAGTAALLFMRSGRFDLLLSFLNELISPTDQDDEDKRYWTDQCQMFESSYLTRRTAVLQYLESRHSMKIVSTNKALRDLRTFFQYVKQQQFDQALGVLSALKLVPLSQEELDIMASKYRDHDSILKQQFPALLSGTARCFYGLHRNLKSEYRGVTDTVYGRLKELEIKMRFIYVFSGLIGTSDSTKEDILRLKNNMG